MDLEKQQEYDELPYFGEANQASSAANRKIAEKMSTLLIVYGKEGMEWSISPAGQRLVRRELPRRSWFHKHEYVERMCRFTGRTRKNAKRTASDSGIWS